jgi:hypothetical protein
MELAREATAVRATGEAKAIQALLISAKARGGEARPSGAPKQAAEAMPSSEGNARAADRARTQGGGQTPTNVCVLRLLLGVYGF